MVSEDVLVQLFPALRGSQLGLTLLSQNGLAVVIVVFGGSVQVSWVLLLLLFETQKLDAFLLVKFGVGFGFHFPPLRIRLQGLRVPGLTHLLHEELVHHA